MRKGVPGREKARMQRGDGRAGSVSKPAPCNSS